jgi:hypothetical protein
MPNSLLDQPRPPFAASGLHFNATLKTLQSSQKSQLLVLLVFRKKNSNLCLNQINITQCFPGDALVNADSEGREFDGFEGGFDAIIVEVDWDSPSLSERTKRKAAFSSGTCFHFE